MKQGGGVDRCDGWTTFWLKTLSTTAGEYKI